MPYIVYLKGLPLPITPSQIKTRINGRNKTLNLINEGEVNQIKSSGLTEISFDFLLPQVKYPFAIYPDNKFKNVKCYLDMIEVLKKQKTPFRFRLGRSTPDFKKLFDTVMNVTLENYTVTDDVGNGLDVLVSVELKEYRNYGTKKLKAVNGVDKSKKTVVEVKSRPAKEVARTYTVKSGDTLVKIAKMELGGTSKWKSIYDLNKKTIEDTAKKHGKQSSSGGRWIFVGTVLKMPKG